MKRTWFSSFQGDSRAVSVFTDSKSEGWEKVGNISVESCDQIFKEIRRIQGRSIPEPPRKLTKLELNIDNDVNIISFLSNYPHFFFVVKPTCCIQFCLIIFINVARSVIEKVFFKDCFAGTL